MKPLDLSRWKVVPNVLIGGGGLLALLGFIFNQQQFGFSWLQSFMFYLSFCIGGLFLVLMHHAFDASWSVPIRRINEHLAFLFTVMAALFIPIAVLAPKMYPWMIALSKNEAEHAIKAKYPLFTFPGFYIVSIVCFVIWILLSWRLRSLSLRQDQTGSVEETMKMRVTAGIGIFLFAISVTLGAIMWMKSLMAEWFSTMYGVYYFAGSVWTTLATVYFISAAMKAQGPLREVMRDKQFYFIGSLLFAFTVFYAYVTFAQYFIIWNANMPEETFWYVLREKGSWWDIGQLMIFGHFFLPFLLLLRIDVKLTWALMLPLTVWAWLMHYSDMTFNVSPVLHPDGFVLHWIDLGCVAFMGGVLSKVFLKFFFSHPPFPQRDPRMAEGLDIYVAPSTPVSTASGRAK